MTLRQWIALICVSSVAGSFSLRLACEASCADGHAAHAAHVTPRCHETPATSDEIQANDDCGSHEVIPALGEVRRVETAIAFTAIASEAKAPRDTTADGFALVTVFADVGPPAYPRTLALRI